MSKQTYQGSCPCGAIRYQIDLDLDAGTTRCNCTICRKTGWWGAATKPSALRVLTGEEHLGDRSRSEAAHARFCTRCGVRVFVHGDIPEIGGEYVSVNLRTLDGTDLTGVKITMLDGLHDTWAFLGTTTHVDPFPSSPPALPR